MKWLLALTVGVASLTVIGCTQPITENENEPVMSSEDLPTSEEELSRLWREESKAYVSAINQFVAVGLRDGWDKAGEEPKDTRSHLAASVMEMVRRANVSGDVDGLRDRFPPAHGPFVEMLEANGQNLEPVALLDDGRILVHIGAHYEEGKVVLIDDLTLTDIPDLVTFGRGPNRRFFALVYEDRIDIRDGWDGPKTCSLDWPTGLEGVPEGFDVPPLEGRPLVTRIIPFPDGQRALLVSPDGIFVLTQQGAVRLMPTVEDQQQHFEWLQKEYPDEELSLNLSMEHGAISQDGRWIAVGSQDSKHLIFNSDYHCVGEVGQLSEYPHYSAFSADGSTILFNSCHFYNGITIGVPVRLLPGLETESYKEDDRIVMLEDGARVYAAASHGDIFIIGDANGYFRAFDLEGNFRWQHFIGSSAGDIDLSPDGKRMVATTYAGFLSIIDLDTGEADPFQIGTATHRERRRWLFWKEQPRPLVW
jgi:hypothetical protein